MEEICLTPNITFTEFLQHLKMSEEDYINAIKSLLKDAKILFKRDPCDTRINGYNKGILKAWEANHDIQFVTDAYACAMYIVSYISKGQRGMSDLLRRACEDAKKGGSDIRSQVREIGNKFTKHTRKLLDHFCSSIPPNDRPFLVKDLEQINRLPDDSEDIHCENVISRYTKRDSRSEMLCLADFAANYDMVFTKAQHKDKSQTELPESDIEPNLEDNPMQDTQDEHKFINLQDKTKLRHRKKPKVIRYVNYSVKQDSENHYRERLMLFSMETGK
ncbi:hypothetical protein MAR_015583 [Mya arenaria]|uniref:Uncharacterized protein n=1 Tax=Mya arenaria TaxID=6604 RepID=A0ABY7FKA0_MYAAR|nr:hypothetical protein MAR_015583 [Mya arenaria]